MIESKWSIKPLELWLLNFERLFTVSHFDTVQSGEVDLAYEVDEGLKVC